MLRQRGVALAIVVWFIAGMSLLVAGIVSHARVDTQMAQLHVARAKAVAAGDGAIQLMLGERLLNVDHAASGVDPLQGNYQLGSIEVAVTLVPAAGFINLNAAPQKVLAVLFFALGQVSEDEANFLADSVVKWRGGLPGKGKTQAHANKFSAIEDLLRIEGMNRTLFDALRDFIVVGQWSGSVTDWSVAPQELMRVLEEANPGKLDAVNRAREQMTHSSTAPGTQAQERSMSGAYRADAVVTYGDQTWLRRRWVSLGSSPGSGLPWHFMRTEPPRVYRKPSGVR